MRSKEIIEAIERLPVASRIRLLEEALRNMRLKEMRGDLSKAAAALEKDYREDKILTAFTALDQERFYEAR